MTSIAHYCQKCLAPNSLGKDFCGRCGTRLMIVVEPPASRYEAGEAVPTDEHLLERISSLENRLTRLSDKLEHSLDLLLRQAQNSYFDRTLIKGLVDLLIEDGLVQSERLERLWHDRCLKDAAEQEDSLRRDQVRLQILSGNKGDENRGFEQLINEGFLLIERKQVDGGVRMLERAAAVAKSAILLSFLGEHYFRAGRTKHARSYLSSAHEAAPNDVRVSLLLGLTCADIGDRNRAKELLNSAMRLGGSSFAVHYGLGQVFAAEEDWRSAVREFKRALNNRPSPEAHYVLGCVYYQLSRDSLALKHLRKAVELDGAYGEAQYLLGLVYQRIGNDELARKAFAAVDGQVDLNKKGAQKAKSAATPLFDGSAAKSNRILTGTGRLAKALREEALKTLPTKPLHERSDKVQ